MVNERLRNTPLRNRKTLRDAAAAVGVPPTTLWKVLKREEIKCVSSTVRPLLTDKNKITRLVWALSWIDRDTMRFDVMRDVVYIDEKCFYLMESTGIFFFFQR